MPGGFGLPYRAPCGGWPETQQWFLGGPFQRYLSSEASIARTQNLTKVLLPGESEAHPPTANLDCGTDWPTGGNCPGVPAPPTNCGPYRPSWPGKKQAPNWRQACGEGETLSADQNCVKAGGDALNFASCRKVGFKNVQAVKSWHGRFGFLSHEPSGRPSRKAFEQYVGNGCPIDNDPLQCGTDTEDLQTGTPDATKYLACTIDVTEAASTTDAAGASLSSYTAEVAQTISVNRYSGVQTLDGCVVSGSGSSPSCADTSDCTTQEAINMTVGIGSAGIWSDLLGHVGFTAGDSIGRYRHYVGGSGWTDTSTDGVSWTATGPEVIYYDSDGNPQSLGYNSASLNVETGALTVTLLGLMGYGALGSLPPGGLASVEDPDSPGSGWYYGVTTTETIAFSDNTHCTHTLVARSGCGATHLNRLRTTTVTITLGTSYTAANLWADVEGLLAAWDLTDDLVYPWRDDEFVTVAPLVSYDEVSFGVKPDAFQGDPGTGACPEWTDPNDSNYSGRVVGAPYVAGTEKVFDWDHITLKKCQDLDGNDHWYPYTYGAGSGPDGGPDGDDRAVPRNAPQWTDNCTASYLWPGAWAWYGTTGSYAPHSGALRLWAQKWAESRVVRPSYNFARPYGRDRYALEESTVGCGWKVGGTTEAPQIASTAAFSAGDKILTWGVGGVTDGQWTVASVGTVGGVPAYTLGSLWTLEADQWDDWRTVGSGIVGKLRWPTAPAIATPLTIQQATNTAPIRLTLDATWLQTGDQLIVAGCTGNTAPNNTGANPQWTITVVDRNTVSLNGSNGVGFGAYTGGGTAKNPNSVAYPEFDDDQPKGEYLAVEWYSTWRDVGENRRVTSDWTAQPCCHWTRSAPAAEPRTGQSGYGMPQEVSTFDSITKCLAWNVGQPVVMCWSPNGEAFDAGDTIDFPSLPFVPDERYYVTDNQAPGSAWFGQFVAHYRDPLWEAPTRPCAAVVDEETETVTYSPEPCPWTEDGGLCQGDALASQCLSGEAAPGGELYYSHAPMVEARDGAPLINGHIPTMPTGISLHVLTLAELNGTPPDGIVLAPPSPAGSTQTGAVLTVDTPWGLFLRELNCECNELRFYVPYNLNGIFC